jgi:hypothetical protein
MTVDELYKELKKLHDEGYGKLNVAYRDECTDRGLSRVSTVDVITDNDRIGKFVILNTKDEI